MIADGLVGIERDTGQPIEIAVLGEGDVLGEMALVTDRPRSASAGARTKVRACRIERDDFLRHIEESPEFSAGIRRVVADRIQDLGDREHVSVEEAGEWASRAVGRLEYLTAAAEISPEIAVAE